MKRLTPGVLVALLLAFAFAAPVAATTEHCPDGWTVKYEANGENQEDINTDVPPAGLVFCVKGSTDASGILVADGVTTLIDYLGNGHDVSYFVIYEDTPSEEPSEAPSEEPSEEPSEAPSERPTPVTSGNPPTEAPVNQPEATLPPTDTAQEPAQPFGGVGGLLALILGSAAIVGGGWAAMKQRRSR